jgi:hypothetical protein
MTVVIHWYLGFFHNYNKANLYGLAVFYYTYFYYCLWPWLVYNIYLSLKRKHAFMVAIYLNFQLPYIQRSYCLICFSFQNNFYYHFIGDTLWHLQNGLQCTLVKFTPSIIHLYFFPAIFREFQKVSFFHFHT